MRELGYDPSVMPWQTEIMDALSDPMVSEVGLMGPAQGGKSQIGLAWLAYCIAHDPADVLVCQPDKAMMQDFVTRRIEPMINGTDVVKAQQLPGASADNKMLKQFRGMLLTHIYPVAAQFTARPVPRGWLDDYDQYDADIEGQGSAVKLLDGRATTFEGKDKKFVSSSPADSKGGKIEAFIAGGTDERVHPRCPSCGERWEIDIGRDLRFDEKGTPADAEASAHVVCGTGNGCILQPNERFRLLASLSDLPNGGWVAANTAAVGGKRRGFRIDGLLCFTSWGKLASGLREAQIAWELRQDESELRTWWNTKAGKNYRSKAAAEAPLDTDDLMKRVEASDWDIGTVPPGVKVITAAVDGQIDRFEVMWKGWGDGLESWNLDYQVIDTAADGVTLLEPATHPEHWLQLIDKVLNRRFPLATNPEITVPVLTMAVDTGGVKGATDNAARLWASARAMGIAGSRITLIKGGNNPRGELLPGAKTADRKAKGQLQKRGVQFFVPNVNAMKSAINARLRREAPGPGYIHFPRQWLREWVEMLTAEELNGEYWQKVRPRNEPIDLEVYNYTALLRPPFMGLSRQSMGWVPRDFRVPEQSIAARDDAPAQTLKAGSTPPAQTDSPPSPPVREAVAARPAERQGGWINPGAGRWI